MVVATAAASAGVSTSTTSTTSCAADDDRRDDDRDHQRPTTTTTTLPATTTTVPDLLAGVNWIQATYASPCGDSSVELVGGSSTQAGQRAVLDDVVGIDSTAGLALAFLSCRGPGGTTTQTTATLVRAKGGDLETLTERELGASSSGRRRQRSQVHGGGTCRSSPAGCLLCRGIQPPDAGRLASRDRRRQRRADPRLRADCQRRPSCRRGRRAGAPQRPPSRSVLPVGQRLARRSRRATRADPPDRAERRAADDSPGADPPHRPVDRSDRPHERRDGRRRLRLPGRPRPRCRWGDRHSDDERLGRRSRLSRQWRVHDGSSELTRATQLPVRRGADRRTERFASSGTSGSPSIDQLLTDARWDARNSMFLGCYRWQAPATGMSCSWSGATPLQLVGLVTDPATPGLGPFFILYARSGAV